MRTVLTPRAGRASRYGPRARGRHGVTVLGSAGRDGVTIQGLGLWPDSNIRGPPSAIPNPPSPTPSPPASPRTPAHTGP
eukprot:1726623-Pyramimonas_sp.AAC.1